MANQTAGGQDVSKYDRPGVLSVELATEERTPQGTVRIVTTDVYSPRCETFYLRNRYYLNGKRVRRADLGY